MKMPIRMLSYNKKKKNVLFTLEDFIITRQRNFHVNIYIFEKG